MGFSYNVNVLNQKGSPAIYTDTFANRPAFGFAGRLFIANDTAAIYEDTGTAWVLIANVSSGAGTLQQVTTNGNTSNVGISVTAGGVSTNSATITSLTTGSVPFVGAAGLITQDNTNLFWDDINNRLGILTNTPSNNLDVHGSGTSPLIAVNNTAGNQALIAFLNTGAARWRIGNTAGNFFDIINMFTSTSAISINSAGNVVTLIGALNGTSCVFSSTITSQTNGSTFGNSAIGGLPLIVKSNAVARAIQLVNTLGGTGQILCGGSASTSFIGFETVATSDAFIVYNDGSNRSNGDVGMWGASTRNLNFFDTTNNNINAQIQYSEVNSNTGQLLFKTNNAGTSTTKLTISNTGQATFTNRINSTVTNDLILSANTSTTEYVYCSMANLIGNARYGVDNSTGGGLGTGTSANSAVFGNAGNSDVDITTNNISRLKIASTGNATFTGQVNVATNTIISYSAAVAQFFGNGATNTFGLGANNTIYFQGDNAQFYPTADGTRNLGAASFRYNTVYATTALINTSDINEKEQIEELTQLEKNVAIKLKGLIKKFKYKDAVNLKGDKARIHIGVIAQEVKEAFDQEGLNADEYGMFCSDTWFELDGVKVENDTEGAIEKTRLGIRYEELIIFIISQI